MFVITPEGERIVNMNNVQAVALDPLNKRKIVAIFNGGDTVVLACYGGKGEAEHALNDLISDLYDGLDVHTLTPPRQMMDKLSRGNHGIR